MANDLPDDLKELINDDRFDFEIGMEDCNPYPDSEFVLGLIRLVKALKAENEAGKQLINCQEKQIYSLEKIHQVSKEAIDFQQAMIDYLELRLKITREYP